MSRSRRTLIVALVGLWAGAVAFGFACLWKYEAAAGAAESPSTNWPTASTIARDNHNTLVLFAHPHCPCTRASVSELARLAARTQGRLQMHVVFIAPDGVDPSWRDSDLVASARRIPGVSVHFDDGRRETRLFGAQTSGSCFLYDPAGRLRFKGGLTIARGHEGDSEGTQAVLSLLDGHQVALAQTPVFGCGLYEPGRDDPDTSVFDGETREP